MRTPSPSYCRLDLAPPSADRFIFEVAPIDYGPVLLLMPFGFHLAMDTLPSGVPPKELPLPLSGQRGITPAFGYDAPHLGVRGTSTLLSNVLLSTHYAAVRLLGDVHTDRTASAFARRPADLRRHPRGLPVPVQKVSRRVWGLRLRRTDPGLALPPGAVLPSAQSDSVGVLIARFRSSIPSPPIPLFMLRCAPRGAQRKTRGRVVRYSFLVRIFHPLLSAGLSRRYRTSAFVKVRGSRVNSKSVGVAHGYPMYPLRG